MKINKIFSVSGKVVLVTGGSRGIGEMITRGFLCNGAKVYISARKKKACDETAERLSSEYDSECISLPEDLSSSIGINKLVDEIKKKEDHIDILVNNAGAVWAEPLDKFSELGWDKVMNINVRSIFFVIQKILPLLRKRANIKNPSRIINIGSIDGINTPTYENYSYSVAKAAVHQLTRIIASKLVGENIICNAIAPGPFPSNMLGSAVGHDYSRISEKNPSKRVGRAEDIVGLAILLSSKAGEYIVGETITCDGGLVASAGHDLTNN